VSRFINRDEHMPASQTVIRHFRDKGGKYRFRVFSAEGEPFATSKPYPNEAAARAGSKAMCLAVREATTTNGETIQ
jgi:hypothetical protein